MPGPLPKDPSTRARRNRASTARTLTAAADMSVPDLPREGMHPRVVEWWLDLWASPMAPEYDASDREGLLALAMLREDFWTAPTARDRKEAAAEIRLQDQRFGLSPMDRRRLQWEIVRAEDAQAKAVRRQPAKAARRGDPRATLQAV